MCWRRIVATAAVLVTAGLAAAPGAQASFHLVQIREVYPGTVANPNSEYVELQMYAAGQNLVGGHVITAYGPTGATTGAGTFVSNVANGASQSTIVMGTAPAGLQFGTLDGVLTSKGAPPPAGMLDPSGGAVCWENLDCVSWGGFSGSLPSKAGTPAMAIPDGMALRRGIASGCATLLESGDDHNDSATDFSPVSPAPRVNSVAPTETACATGTPPHDPPEAEPQTTLRRKPAVRTKDRTPTFVFVSSRPGSTFECALDHGRFHPCHSPLTTKPLSVGRHTFKVRATNRLEVTDPSPARYTFKVLPRS